MHFTQKRLPHVHRSFKPQSYSQDVKPSSTSSSVTKANNNNVAFQFLFFLFSFCGLPSLLLIQQKATHHLSGGVHWCHHKATILCSFSLAECHGSKRETLGLVGGCLSLKLWTCELLPGLPAIEAAVEAGIEGGWLSRSYSRHYPQSQKHICMYAGADPGSCNFLYCCSPLLSTLLFSSASCSSLD